MKAIYEMFRADAACKKTANENLAVKEWAHLMAKELDPSLIGYDAQTIDMIIQILLVEQSMRDITFDNLLRRYVEVVKGMGGVY